MSQTPPSLEIVPDPDLRQPIDVAWLTRQVVKVQESCGAPIVRLAVAIIGDVRMVQLHQRHCGIDATTDVLTFTQSSPGEPIDADIAICADEAARRAAEFGHSIESELLLYLLHGVLHCMGFDDHDDGAYERMHAEEDRILQAIGVGATFKPDSTARDTAGRHSRTPRAAP